MTGTSISPRSTWQVKALVEATPISGPACRYMPQSVLSFPSVRRFDFLRLQWNSESSTHEQCSNPPRSPHQWSRPVAVPLSGQTMNLKKPHTPSSTCSHAQPVPTACTVTVYFAQKDPLDLFLVTPIRKSKTDFSKLHMICMWLHVLDCGFCGCFRGGTWLDQTLHIRSDADARDARRRRFMLLGHLNGLAW